MSPDLKALFYNFKVLFLAFLTLLTLSSCFRAEKPDPVKVRNDEKVQEAWASMQEDQMYDFAIATLDSVLVIDPDHSEAWCARGTAYLWKRDFASAISDLTRAIELDPEYTLAFMNRGISYHDNGQKSLARQDFDRLIELSPRSEETLRKLGYY